MSDSGRMEMGLMKILDYLDVAIDATKRLDKDIKDMDDKINKKIAYIEERLNNLENKKRGLFLK